MKSKPASPSGSLFRMHKAYSPEEILASGGATAFGRKSGKDNFTLIETLKIAPPAEPFTDEEWDETLHQLRDNKE